MILPPLPYETQAALILERHPAWTLDTIGRLTDWQIAAILNHPRDDDDRILLPEGWGEGQAFLAFEQSFWRENLASGLTPSQIEIAWRPVMGAWLRSNYFGGGAGAGGVKRGGRTTTGTD